MKFNHILLGLSVMLTLCSCSPREFRHASGAKWGTVYHITYEADFDLSDSITAEMSRIEMSLSPFQPSSIVSAINRGENATIDKYIATVFEYSQKVNNASGGAFDPTVGPLVDLWGFGTDKGVNDAPAQAQIDSALAGVGIWRCKISGNHIVKPDNGTQFNFSAIAKGYGCDCVAEMLKRNGVENYMVEIGGEIALGGHNPKGKTWTIQVDAPIVDATASNRKRMTTVSLTDCGIATSGNYRNYRDYRHGGRVGHTINPRTGHPVATTTLSATVIAPTCMEADALATACMAMPLGQAMSMIANWPGASALLVDTDSMDSLRMHATDGFPTLK